MSNISKVNAISGTSIAKLTGIANASISKVGGDTLVAPFTPKSISNITLWLDGSDSSASSMTLVSDTHVSVWKDKSGNGYDFSQNSDSLRPILVPNNINGLSTVQAITTDKKMNNTTLSVPYNSPWSFVLVTKMHEETDQNWPYIFSFKASGTNQGIGFMTHNTMGLIASGHSSYFKGWYTGYTTYYTAGSRKAILTWDGSSTWTNLIDGTARAMTGDSSNENNSVSQLFFCDVGGQRMGGSIAELIVYNKVLTAGDITNLNSYILSKWGI